SIVRISLFKGRWNSDGHLLPTRKVHYPHGQSGFVSKVIFNHNAEFMVEVSSNYPNRNGLSNTGNGKRTSWLYRDRSDYAVVIFDFDTVNVLVCPCGP